MTLIYATITTIVLSVVIFLVFKGYQVKEPVKGEQERLSAFTQKQILTLIGFLVMIVVSALFKRNVGLVSFTVAVVLMLLNAADEKVVIKGVPWSTLLMVTGIGMLMNIVSSVGGVELMSNGLASIMSPRTAVAIQGLVRWHPLLVQLRHRRGVAHHGPHRRRYRGASGRQPREPDHHHVPDSLLRRLQPASTGGSLILAANATDPDFTKEKENKLFLQLFALSALLLVLTVLGGLLGLYSIL